MIDWKALALSIKRCNAAYNVDPKVAAKAFADLGSTFIDQYRNDNHQAVLSHNAAGKITLTISGTRFSAGPLPDRIGDLIEDVDWNPVDIGDGCLVAKGAYDSMDKLWKWVLDIVEPDEVNPLDVEGHSLGGWRAAYTPLYLPKSHIGKITRFEPPKAGNAAFWVKYFDGIDMTTVVNARDPWVAWPWAAGSRLIQPLGRSLLWLHDGIWSIIGEPEWPGVSKDLTFSDHGPDTVITAIDKLAA